MAKRKRLDTTPISPEAAVIEAIRAPLPPIAGVAGEAAIEAAGREVFDEMEAARREGRMVVRLSLADIDMGHLLRDRLASAAGDEEMEALIASIRTHGQRTPIEVVETSQGRYGLISGWRRMTALAAIGGQQAEVLAILRAPHEERDAYIAMVEENEIRVGLSYFERARVAIQATKAGAFPSVEAAVDALFAAGSKAKRSKIRSFISIVDQLEPALRYPAALSERLGMRLAAALKEGRGVRVMEALFDLPDTCTPEDEAAAIAALLPDAPSAKKTGAGTSAKAKKKDDGPVEIVRGLDMDVLGKTGSKRIVITGDRVDSSFMVALTEFIIHWDKNK